MRHTRRSRGFTLIELLVVVLIIGILSAIAIPQYFKVVEKGRAAEVVGYIGDMRSAQERYALRTGTYASDANVLDVSVPMLKYFSNVATITPGNTTSGWMVVFTRNGTPATPSPYTPQYQVSFNSYLGNYSCPNDTSKSDVANDLLPQ
jgi:prepilin-type N-terminal cleavage/methylation domain-containing protein